MRIILFYWTLANYDFRVLVNGRRQWVTCETLDTNPDD